MNQSEIRKYLAAYADGELPEELRRALDAAVAQDPEYRTEVARWQALRRSARRALESEPLPAGLRARVLARLAPAQGLGPAPRLRLLVGALTAVAAVIAVSTVLLWPRRPTGGPPAPTGPLVEARQLIEIYRKCALANRHDKFGLAGQPPAAAAAALAARTDTTYARVLDLSGCGYRLGGVCDCRPEGAVPWIHAFYERADRAPGRTPIPGDVVSFFSISQRVRCCGEPYHGCFQPSTRPLSRNYVVATTEEVVTVIVWDDGDRSFAACSELTGDDLVALLESVNVAALLAPENRGNRDRHLF